MLRKLLLSFITVVSSLLWGYGCGDGKDNAYWQKYSRETIGRIINQPVKMPDSILGSRTNESYIRARDFMYMDEINSKLQL